MHAQQEQIERCERKVDPRRRSLRFSSFLPLLSLISSDRSSYSVHSYSYSLYSPSQSHPPRLCPTRIRPLSPLTPPTHTSLALSPTRSSGRSDEGEEHRVDGLDHPSLVSLDEDEHSLTVLFSPTDPSLPRFLLVLLSFLLDNVPGTSLPPLLHPPLAHPLFLLQLALFSPLDSTFPLLLQQPCLPASSSSVVRTLPSHLFTPR